MVHSEAQQTEPQHAARHRSAPVGVTRQARLETALLRPEGALWLQRSGGGNRLVSELVRLGPGAGAGGADGAVVQRARSRGLADLVEDYDEDHTDTADERDDEATELKARYAPPPAPTLWDFVRGPLTEADAQARARAEENRTLEKKRSEDEAKRQRAKEKRQRQKERRRQAKAEKLAQQPQPEPEQQLEEQAALPPVLDEGFTEVTSRKEKQHRAHREFDLGQLRRQIDAHRGAPSAISETFNQFINGSAAQGGIAPGAIVAAYQTSAERGKPRFSVEVTIVGLNNWVLHAHLDGTGNVAPGKNPIHYKRVSQRGDVGVSITLSPAQIRALLPPAQDCLAAARRGRLSGV